MNSFIKQLIRRLPRTSHSVSKEYHSHSSIVKFVIQPQPFVSSTTNIFQLVQKNVVIPLIDFIPKSSILDRPRTDIIGKIEDAALQKIDIAPCKNIYDPDNYIEKKAHVMLRIKRKKMNRHKYLKRQRKLRFYYMRIRRVRHQKKENAFRAEIAMKLKELEKFDPTEYVASKLEAYRQVVLPNRIRTGVRMPPFVIIEQLEKVKRRKQELEEKKDRKRKFMTENGGTLEVKS